MGCWCRGTGIWEFNDDNNAGDFDMTDQKLPKSVTIQEADNGWICTYYDGEQWHTMLFVNWGAVGAWFAGFFGGKVVTASGPGFGKEEPYNLEKREDRGPTVVKAESDKHEHLAMFGHLSKDGLIGKMRLTCPSCITECGLDDICPRCGWTPKPEAEEISDDLEKLVDKSMREHNCECRDVKMGRRSDGEQN